MIYEKAGVQYKLCKVLFGSDGPYYVTSPYHPAKRAVVLKATINYALPEQNLSLDDAIEVAVFDDDRRRLKLAHHTDGFLQFSGAGVISGKDDDGRIRGIGVMSWPLTSPTLGPSFGITMTGVEKFEVRTRQVDYACIFREDELIKVPKATGLALEGYYFPPLWRRFIRQHPDGIGRIGLAHPAGALLQLKVLLPQERCAWPGFIGVELYSCPVEGDGLNEPGFFISGSTGNLRRNDDGELLGDGIFALYPRGSLGRVNTRNLAYMVASPSYKAPTGHAASYEPRG